MKKLLSLLLCMVMLCSLGITAFAQDTTAESETSEPAEAAESSETAADTAQISGGLIDEAYLQQIISDYVADSGMASGESAVSIGYCYTATGDMWFYNGDDWYYSASLYKVPVTMLLEEKENAGEITQDTVIESQYSTGTVADMEHKSIVYSDNYTGHAMVEYLGGTYSGKCTDQTIKYTDLSEDYFPDSFYDYSYYSAKYYTEVLKYLYDNKDLFPHIIPYMEEAVEYEQSADGLYFLSSVDYEVAQKYGSYIENQGQGDNNIHVGGIIYTPNPIIVTIMTKNQTNADIKIGDIASLLVDYTLELDSQVEEYRVEQERAAAEAAAAAEKAEQERIEAEAAAQAEAERQAEIQRQNEELAQLRAEQAERKSKTTKIIVTIVEVLIALLAVFVIVAKILPLVKNSLKNKSGTKSAGGASFKTSKAKKKRSTRANRYDDDDFDDDEEDEYFKESDFIQPGRKSSQAPAKQYIDDEYFGGNAADEDEDEYEEDEEETDERPEIIRPVRYYDEVSEDEEDTDEDDEEYDDEDDEESAENLGKKLFGSIIKRRSSKDDYDDLDDEETEEDIDDDDDDDNFDGFGREIRNPLSKFMSKKDSGSAKQSKNKKNSGNGGYVPRH